MEEKYLAGFREVIKMAGIESAFVAHAKRTVDNMLGEEDNSIDDIPDSMLKEYFDTNFGGNWKNALNYWLN